MKRQTSHRILDLLSTRKPDTVRQAWELIRTLAASDRRFYSDLQRHVASWIDARAADVDRGARSRTWQHAYSVTFAIWLTDAIRTALQHGLDLSHVTVRCDAGSVPNSYKRTAHTTTALLDDRGLLFARTSAYKRPHGASADLCRLRVAAGTAAHRQLKTDSRYRAGYLRLH